MTDPLTGGYPARIVDEATEWQLRLESPTPQIEAGFRKWINAAPLHAEAFEAVCGNWTASEIIVEGAAGRDRKLIKAPFYMRRSTQVAVGTCLAVIAAAGLVVSVGGINRGSVIASARAATFQTRIGEIRTVSLADGTQVVLDTNSLLRTVASELNAVELVRGRARFAPAQSGRVFTVVTPQGRVRAYSARFDVSLIDARPRITTISGRTVLERAGTGGRPLVLHEGQQGGFATQSRVEQVVAGQLLWVKGMLVFDDVPLSDAVDALNRYNHTRIEIGMPTASGRVTGAFSARDPEAFAMAVAALFSLSVSHAGDGTIVLRSK